jgi:hypothetical protein
MRNADLMEQCPLSAEIVAKVESRNDARDGLFSGKLSMRLFVSPLTTLKA